MSFFQGQARSRVHPQIKNHYVNTLFNFEDMYIIYINIGSKNFNSYLKYLKVLYNTKNYINHKNTISVHNDFPNTFLAAQMRSISLAHSSVF